MRPLATPFVVFMLALLLPTADAWSSQWEPVAISEDHEAWLFLDFASIKRSKSGPTARVMTEYAEPQPGIAETDFRPYVIIRNRVRFNCAKRLSMALEEDYLDADDVLLGEKEFIEKEKEWEPVLTGSLIEEVYDIVCKKSSRLELTERNEGKD